mgnify:CR=1 FL=1
MGYYKKLFIILDYTIKSNLGMDACTGLYDEYFKGGN